MNVENEMWEQLKAEIKSELREELKAEIIKEIREELVASATTRFKDLIFKERHFEVMTKTYIQSLCHEDVNFQKLRIQGNLKQEEIAYEIPNLSQGNIWMTIKRNVDFKEIYDRYMKAKLLKCSFEDFKCVINFIDCDVKVEWFDFARKTFTYSRLFELYEEIYEDDFSDLNPQLRLRFINYLSLHFRFGGKTKLPKLMMKRFDAKYQSQ